MNTPQARPGSSTSFFIVITIFVIGFGSLLLRKPESIQTIDQLAGIETSPTSTLTKPSTLPTPQQEQDATKNWQGYSIPFLAVSVKVPPGWFIATDETDPNHVRIRSASPEAHLEDQATVFNLDISKVEGMTSVKTITDLRVEFTKKQHSHLASKGSVSGENEVTIDNLSGIYRQLQPTGGGLVQQLIIITSKGTVGLFESTPHDQNQISLFNIIAGTIKRL